MQVFRMMIAVSALAVVVMVFSGAMRNQEPSVLETRVELLELRVKKLESVLFATAQLTVMEAREELAQAETRFDNSRRLQIKGFITLAQLEADRFQVEQARRQLELAQATDGQQRIVGQIDILEAKRDLQVAEENLIYQRKRYEKGFVSERDVQIAEENVRRFQRRLDLAETKADAAGEILRIQRERAAKDDEKLPQDPPDNQDAPARDNQGNGKQ